MNSLEALKQLRGRLNEIESLRRFIDRVMDLATSCTPIMREVVASSNTTSDRIAKEAIRLVELRARLNEKLLGLADQIAESCMIIEAIDDATDRTMLSLYYLEGLTWDKVGERVGYSANQCINRRNAIFDLKQ